MNRQFGFFFLNLFEHNLIKQTNSNEKLKFNMEFKSLSDLAENIIQLCHRGGFRGGDIYPKKVDPSKASGPYIKKANTDLLLSILGIFTPA